ncbi:MAG: (Fe-S)-binding protein [Gammaproteobacteria bacterium]
MADESTTHLRSTLTLPDWFDERFGADLYHCASCNYCVDAVWPERGIRHVCATLEHHSPSPGYSGRGFIDTARALLEGVPLAADSVAERVFTCTTCGNCEVACPIGLRPASIGGALREVLAGADVMPAPVREARATILEQGGASCTAPGPWRERAVGAPGATALFAGCAARAADGPAAAVDAWLAAGGFTPAWQDETRCCGTALAELGAAREAAAWRAALGVDAATPLVVLGYECLAHLCAGGHAAAMSLPAWLDAGLTAGTLAIVPRADLPPPPRLRLLETCQLKPRPGRTASTDEACARALLEYLGFALDAASFPNAHALCCGAAGGMPVAAPASATRMAAARLAGGAADSLALTLDARCAAHLRTAGDHAVTDFASFLAHYTRLTRLGAAT